MLARRPKPGVDPFLTTPILAASAAELLALVADQVLGLGLGLNQPIAGDWSANNLSVITVVLCIAPAIPYNSGSRAASLRSSRCMPRLPAKESQQRCYNIYEGFVTHLHTAFFALLG